MRILFLTICWLLTQLSFAAQPQQDVEYEQKILESIKNIQNLEHEQALQSTRELIDKYPYSRLGQMLYADLLMAKVGPLDSIGLGIPGVHELNDFQYEIKQRWAHETDTAHRGLYPQNILGIGEKQPYAILVDQSSSRIYVYRNEQGTPVLETDYFITIGLKGAGKEKRGDQKTPIGIYHVTEHINGEDLPDLYGKGAFPINYPNVWDKRKGRTGSGIWIHGTPSNTYNRSPLASNGCIVVSNPDLVHIDRYLSPDFHTPVIVAEHVNWLSHDEWEKQRKEMLSVLTSWAFDWESLDHERYMANYSTDEFYAYNRDFKKWDNHKRWVNRNKTHVKVEYNNLNIFRYPGEKNLILMQFNQEYESSNLDLKSRKEIYWQKRSSRWQIVYEGARTFPKTSTEIVLNE